MNAGVPACILPQSVEALPRAIVEDLHAATNPPDFPHDDEPGFASAGDWKLGRAGQTMFEKNGQESSATRVATTRKATTQNKNKNKNNNNKKKKKKKNNNNNNQEDEDEEEKKLQYAL